ncbi:lysozyme inhibitor LprI family protein [Vibrio tritonius]|uniref:lysozyme inhibitor LprI family protein n=1 Tax=Vibrio tritonius TaxID=1435069 RepID=UPI000837BA60|nr:lysozyme inhibitor LprI family protein [Vibrio tritonius]
MKKIYAGLLVTFASHAMAFDIDPRCNLPEQLCELQLKFEASDQELNDVYQHIMSHIESDYFAASMVDKKEIKDSLIKSERAWLAFLKQNCNAVRVLNSGGSGKNEAETECLIDMTNQRIHFLKETYR